MLIPDLILGIVLLLQRLHGIVAFLLHVKVDIRDCLTPFSGT